MNKNCLYLLAIMILNMTILKSCVVSTVVDDINDTTDNKRETAEEQIKSKSADDNASILSIQIKNNAPYTSLYLDSVEICNILVKEAVSGNLKMGNITLLRCKEKMPIDYGAIAACPQATLPAQKFIPWNPGILPEESNNMYVKIYGQMYSYTEEGELFPLCSGPMYFTFSEPLVGQQISNIVFEVCDNCPLYCQSDGKCTKVLRSISFEISVADWQ